MNDSRQPAGTPIGGQFASHDRADADLTLSNEIATGPQPAREFAIEMLGTDGATFDAHFTPQQIFDQTPRIYDYLNECGQDADSVSREALFSYAAEQLNLPYETLYDRWMSGITLAIPN